MDALRTNSQSQVLFAVQENVSRHFLDWIAFSEFSRVHTGNEMPILCLAEFKEARRSKKPSVRELEELLQLGDHKLERISPILPLGKGMSAYVTQNIATQLGVANGSFEIVVGVQFATDTIFHRVVIHGIQMQVASKLPEMVFVDIPNSRLPQRFPSLPNHYHDSVVPIASFSKTGVRVN